eukprot:659370-Hanusia_phi.AAC.2
MSACRAGASAKTGLGRCYEDGTVRVWDVETGTCRQVLKEDVTALKSVSMSGDGKTVASGSEDKTVQVWDVETKPSWHIRTGHECMVWA